VKEEDCLEDKIIEGRRILIWTLKKYNGKVLNYNVILNYCRGFPWPIIFKSEIIK
jgi:hypothetical protein